MRAVWRLCRGRLSAPTLAAKVCTGTDSDRRCPVGARSRFHRALAAADHPRRQCPRELGRSMTMAAATSTAVFLTLQLVWKGWESAERSLVLTEEAAPCGLITRSFGAEPDVVD